MTDPERTEIAEKLLMLVFSLRPDDSLASQAWVLSTATTMMSRAILASVGPGGDVTELKAMAMQQVDVAVEAAQKAFYRDQLTRQDPPRRRM